MADEAVSYPLWNEVYKDNLVAQGSQKAALMADEAIVRTHGSGSVIDQAEIQRGNEYKKMVTWWYSWSSMMFNRAWLGGKIAGLQYDAGNLGTAAVIMGKTLAFTIIAPAMTDALWSEAFRNAPNGIDDDKRKKRLIKAALNAPAAYIPGLKDVWQVATDQIMGGQSHVSLPLAGALDNIGKPFFELTKSVVSGSEPPDRLGEDFANAASILTGSPQQLNSWIFNYLDFIHGEGELTWRDVLTRRVKS